LKDALTCLSDSCFRTPLLSLVFSQPPTARRPLCPEFCTVQHFLSLRFNASFRPRPLGTKRSKGDWCIAGKHGKKALRQWTRTTLLRDQPSSWHANFRREPHSIIRHRRGSCKGNLSPRTRLLRVIPSTCSPPHYLEGRIQDLRTTASGSSSHQDSVQGVARRGVRKSRCAERGR